MISSSKLPAVVGVTVIRTLVVCLPIVGIAVVILLVVGTCTLEYIQQCK